MLAKEKENMNNMNGVVITDYCPKRTHGNTRLGQMQSFPVAILIYYYNFHNFDRRYR